MDGSAEKTSARSGEKGEQLLGHADSSIWRERAEHRIASLEYSVENLKGPVRHNAYYMAQLVLCSKRRWLAYAPVSGAPRFIYQLIIMSSDYVDMNLLNPVYRRASLPPDDWRRYWTALPTQRQPSVRQLRQAIRQGIRAHIQCDIGSALSAIAAPLSDSELERARNAYLSPITDRVLASAAQDFLSIISSCLDIPVPRRIKPRLISVLYSMGIDPSVRTVQRWRVETWRRSVHGSNTN